MAMDTEDWDRCLSTGTAVFLLGPGADRGPLLTFIGFSEDWAWRQWETTGSGEQVLAPQGPWVEESPSLNNHPGAF